VELVVSLSQPGMAVTRVLFLSGGRGYDAAQLPEVRGCHPVTMECSCEVLST